MIDPARDDLRADAVEPRTWTESRAALALRRPHNWMQLAKFCTVGASGYAVNLAVYTALLELAGFHYLGAALVSFLVAVTNNYLWNRLWTFRNQRGHVAYQGMRFLVVSTAALGANLLILHLLVEAGLGKIVAQALAIVLVTPLNFVGNKLWSFSGNGPVLRPLARRLWRRVASPRRS
jgi:dolichol-phosphate mannosyltransferase